MAGFPRPEFSPDEIRERYDVSDFHEDAWHTYTDEKTREIIQHELGSRGPLDHEWLLNAGAGVYSVSLSGWLEVSLGLFVRPIMGRCISVCGSVEAIPFKDSTFGAVVCVGEVLAYCDPANALREFSRVLKPGGTLIELLPVLKTPS